MKTLPRLGDHELGDVDRDDADRGSGDRLRGVYVNDGDGEHKVYVVHVVEVAAGRWRGDVVGGLTGGIAILGGIPVLVAQVITDGVDGGDDSLDI